MLSVGKSLVFILARAFYREYAGIFLLLFLFVFAILRPIEHILILQAAVGSSTVLFLLLVVWALYFYILMRFNLRRLRQADILFLQNFLLFSRFRRFLLLLQIYLLQFLPVLVYVSATLLLSFTHSAWHTAVIATVFLLTTATINIYLMIFVLMPHRQFVFATALLRPLKVKISDLSFFFWLSQLKRHIFSLVLTKILSLAILQFTYQLYANGGYDYRLVSFCCLLIASIHLGLVSKYFQFMFYELEISRSLPFSLAYRFFRLCLNILFMLSPEIISLLRMISLPEQRIIDYCGYVLIFAGIGTLFYTELIRLQKPFRKTLNRYFLYFLIVFLLIIYHTPSLLIGAGFLLLSWWSFRKHYAGYEVREEKY